MKRVFVSYSRNNLDIVTQLIQDLQAVGVDTWHDQTLTGGQRWWDNILSNIRDCDIFIFALSPESWDSDACRSELRYVIQLGKTVLPVLVADGINLNLLPAPLNEIQVTDFRRRDKEAAFALVKSINTAAPAPPAPRPASPFSRCSGLLSQQPSGADRFQRHVEFPGSDYASLRAGRGPAGWKIAHGNSRSSLEVETARRPFG